MTLLGDALRQGHARRYVVVGVAIVVLAAAVLAGRALADTGSGDTSFRTAVVKRASVSQSLQRSGTIEPVAQGTVAFPISGTVSTVGVQPGQAVTTGQTLATLDPTTLQAALTSKQATLAAAQLTLNNALNGISSGPGSGSGPSTNANTARTTTTTARTTNSSSPSASAANPGDAAALAHARQAVASGQQRVDGALSTAGAALSEAAGVCTEAKNAGGSTSSSSTTSSSSASASSTTTTAPPSSAASTACLEALQKSLAAQQQVSGAQAALAQAEDDLDSLLSSASSSNGSTRTPSTAATNASNSSSRSSSPSSAELVADQAAVDAAQADVTSAEQNLAQATIVSPIDGTVAAVNLTPGDQVSAGSSTANITVVGSGGYEVTTTVNVTDIGKVKLGDAATVTPDGSSTTLDGKVVSIGVMPSTNGTTTTYPVFIGLTGSPSSDLHNGASAAVTIVLSHAADALTVPTSAVRSFGGGGIQVVAVVSGGKTTNVPVQVGAVGAELTEIRSGLQEGQTVVLADLSQPLPSNNTNTNGRGGFGGGGLGGGGGFGGGGLGGGGNLTRGG